MNRDDWNRRYQGAELVWTAEPNRFLVAETDGLAPGRALDLACGEGRNAVWLARRGWQVTGVDYSDVAIEKGRRLAEHAGVEVDWIVADLLEYVPHAARYDLVVALYLQVPAAERQRIVRRAAEAVAPGGTFLLVGHDAANLEQGYGGPRDPAVLYTAAEVAAGLPGLEIERAEPVIRTVETDEGIREAIDALVRAHRPASALAS